MTRLGSIANALLRTTAAAGLMAVASLAFGQGAWTAGEVVPGNAGDAVCAKCHKEYTETYTQSVHSRKGAKGTPAATGAGCTSCHKGNVQEHIKSASNGKGPGPMQGFSNPKRPAAEKSAVCQTCHETNRQLTFWDSGKHKSNDVTCANCHSIHGKAKDPSVAPYANTVKPLQYETCVTCHKSTRSQINKPSHHPIIEGKVKCSDCHNPHGALSPAMIKSETVNSLCYSCHSEKRGPYAFEHPPVEQNCASCHQPHGSTHYKLLNEKVPNLCQDCHDWSKHPGTIYSGSQGWSPGANNTRLISRSCLNCHNAIHGSNAPANRGLFFIR